MRPELSATISVWLFVATSGSSHTAAQTDQQINRLQEMARESRSEWQIKHAYVVARADRAETMVSSGLEFDARDMAWEVGIESFNRDENVSELAEAESTT